MEKKTNSNYYLFAILFCARHICKVKKKKEKSKNAPAKVEAKAPESKDGKKEPKPYKKVIDSQPQ
jgi:hypothetical protein